MAKTVHLLEFMLFLLFGVISFAAESGPVTISQDESTGTYTFIENGLPVLSYHFATVPLPEGVTPHRFSKGKQEYDGAYFSDGSTYGADRSDYIQPLYGFKGEALTDDFPADHLHHRGLWWSWCEVRYQDKIGDIWAVNKIRAYPVKITKSESKPDSANFEAINVWRFDDDPTEVVRETVTIQVNRTLGDEGNKTRLIAIDLKLDALVDGIAITGRQKVDYGGYGGMTVRMVPQATDFSLRAVHPRPDQWKGSEHQMAEVVTDPVSWGNAAWLALYGKYPLPGEKEVPTDRNVTTLMMFESSDMLQAPNNLRYYGSRCISLAFPGFNVVPITRGEPLVYKTRFWLQQGRTDLKAEKEIWDKYAK